MLKFITTESRSETQKMRSPPLINKITLFLLTLASFMHYFTRKIGQNELLFLLFKYTVPYIRSRTKNFNIRPPKTGFMTEISVLARTFDKIIIDKKAYVSKHFGEYILVNT